MKPSPRGTDHRNDVAVSTNGFLLGFTNEPSPKGSLPRMDHRRFPPKGTKVSQYQSIIPRRAPKRILPPPKGTKVLSICISQINFCFPRRVPECNRQICIEKSTTILRIYTISSLSPNWHVKIVAAASVLLAIATTKRVW